MYNWHISIPDLHAQSEVNKDGLDPRKCHIPVGVVS